MASTCFDSLLPRKMCIYPLCTRVNNQVGTELGYWLEGRGSIPAEHGFYSIFQTDSCVQPVPYRLGPEGTAFLIVITDLEYLKALKRH
jgi:hypothetical protein